MSSDPVPAFEKKFAGMIGSDYAIAVNSGTSALHAALEAIDVWGGEVIMPALCPGLVAFPVIHAGARPMFADVDPDTQVLTADTIRRVITSRTKAVIVVALHGLPTDIDSIVRLCKPLKIAVIEDCAQALFARYKDVFAGTKADIGCYSFERKKHMTTGSEGGMIVTNNGNYAVTARKFGGLGYRHLVGDGGGTRVPLISPGYQRFDTIGLNYRLSAVQAEIGLQKLKTVMDAVWTRQEIGLLWEQAIGERLQVHDYSADNACYSAAWPYQGNWRQLAVDFLNAGGDGFYAMPELVFNEPAMAEYASGEVMPWEVPQSVRLQPQLVLFKTHYTLAEAKRQCGILKGVLDSAKISRVLA